MQTQDFVRAFGVAFLAFVIAAGITFFYDDQMWLRAGLLFGLGAFLGRLVFIRSERKKTTPSIAK